MTSAQSAEPGLRVAIAGGSLGGLAAGIALQAIGAEVRIFERDAGPVETRGAGIVVQVELMRFLEAHDAPPLPTTGCRVRRYLQPEGGAGRIEPVAQRFTSWEAIYTTLRAMVPDPCLHRGAALTDFTPAADHVAITIADRAPERVDLLVCADGANAQSRRRVLPATAPRDAGYVAWRGTLDEALVPPDLLAFFDDAFTFSAARSGGHILAYPIPGAGADVQPGKRRLNWVWYVAADAAERARLLVDRHGRRHHASVAQGLAAEALVHELHARARAEVHPEFARLVQATPDPFLQTITDVAVPRTRFGRAILLGDAAFVVRPHTAGATAKAVQDAATLATALQEAAPDVDRGLAAAERRQLDYGQRLLAHGIALGRDWVSRI